ncbi:hypothetical protein F4779DRAFT_640371 [Xylariaceae sp. FL0662B]|nr:hypothetical protein F4779DRAFT_640371 [Xylariaceae sp. FL0662B]
MLILDAVVIPYVEEDEDGDRTYSNDFDPSQGFLLVEIFDNRIFVVQSVANRTLYFVKILRRVGGRGEDTTDTQFTHDEPPYLRVSTAPDAEVPLPLEPHFPRIVFYQQVDGYWELYFKYHNGGTLKALRDRYYEARRRIPEEFIWHVTAELCQALAFLYYGQEAGSGNRPGVWRVVYHRSIAETNVMINYPLRPRGRLPNSGNPNNAFPDIVLVDFGESAIDGDDDNDLKPGIFWEGQKNEWEDVYQLGCVLRGLCMTHVLFPKEDPNVPNNSIPGQFKDESNGWIHRPDSRRLAAVNAHPVGPAYSNELINSLSMFEWPGQQTTLIDLGVYRNFVPGVDWVVNTLLPRAVNRVRQYRTGPKPAGYYNALDVSWTKPYMPMPYVADTKKRNLNTTLQRALERDDFELCGLEYPVPRITRPLPGPP